MPAAPETVADFIADSAEQGLRPSTIGRRVAAIRYLHRQADEETPTRSELVSKTLKGIRWEMGGAPGRKAAATADIVERMIDTCDDSLKGLRDRAILALGFAGAFRRSELVVLRVEDLSRTDDGYRVLIRKSKTDQEGQGQTIAIPRGNRLRPGPAIEAWMAAAGIESGPLFRRVRPGGKVGAQPLRPAAVAEIVKERCLLINEDPAQFSGALRAIRRPDQRGARRGDDLQDARRQSAQESGDAERVCAGCGSVQEPCRFGIFVRG